MLHSNSGMSKRFYITTAIDYVNGQPHLGHAYEKVVADAIARSRQSMGEEPFFLTGLDEHGQKVQQAAIAEGKDPQKYCDDLFQDWKRFTATLKLSNDDLFGPLNRDIRLLFRRFWTSSTRRATSIKRSIRGSIQPGRRRF